MHKINSKTNLFGFSWFIKNFKVKNILIGDLIYDIIYKIFLQIY